MPDLEYITSILHFQYMIIFYFVLWEYEALERKSSLLVVEFIALGPALPGVEDDAREDSRSDGRQSGHHEERARPQTQTHFQEELCAFMIRIDMRLKVAEWYKY